MSQPNKLILCNQTRPLTDEQKAAMIEDAAKHYGAFLTALGYDWENDHNMNRTPYRYAKSIVNDLCNGNFTELPQITSFPNDCGDEQPYKGMIIQTNIEVKSMCSHHHREIKGKCHIGIIPGADGRLIGLSKFNRIVDHFSRRFQLQEALTKQIHDYINEVCKHNRGVAVTIAATHGCVSCRGINHDSTMITNQLSGYFFDNSVGTRTEYFSLIKQ
jgi:GTP cyclohydrolase I